MKSLPPSIPDKATLRADLLARRRGISDVQRAVWDNAIAERLEQWLAAHAVASLGVFWPIRKEPDLLPLYERLAARGVRLALPVVIDKNAPLRFAAWQPGDVMVRDGFGVPVPQNPSFVPMPQALLIPCVGFDAQNYRLGYGGGFYDRTLATAPRPLAVGIAYACQQSEFATDEHDIALDVILTD